MMTDRHVDTDARGPVQMAADRPTPDADAGWNDTAGYDDGLVHDHGWACRERGAQTF